MSKISIEGNALGSGTFTIASPNSNTSRTLTLPDSTGTVVVTGTTPSLNGITFPATQVASADVNTLDDYEEGTWTPTLLGSTGNPTQSYLTSATVGRYTKIGNVVTLSFRVHMAASGISGGTGTVQIGGLPFASVNVSNLIQGGAISQCASWSTTNTGAPTNIALNNNSTTLLDLSTYQNDAGKVAGSTATNAADITNSTNVAGTITYIFA